MPRGSPCAEPRPPRATVRRREAGRVEKVRVQQGEGQSPAAMEAALRDEGFEPYRWSNAAGYHYAPHDHDYDSVIVCTAGTITFHVEGRDMVLRPGDRIDLPAGIQHAATVGPEGVECLEGTS
jgi:quercetin dioxygenase-like cupin family protein